MIVSVRGIKSYDGNHSKIESHFLRSLVFRLRISITSPEEEITTQKEFGTDMYFIAKGDCGVKFMDRRGAVHISETLLTEGDHFGEIALLYRCKRTASVVSRNYNILACIHYSKFKDIIAEYPLYELLLKKHCFSYHDSNKRFLLKLLEKISFLNSKLSEEVIHEILYSLESRDFEDGQIIKRINEPIHSIYFVASGSVEVVSEFDGHEFVIDCLGEGSVINENSFLIEDTSRVNLRCKQYCTLLSLNRTQVNNIAQKHFSFLKRLYYFSYKALN